MKVTLLDLDPISDSLDQYSLCSFPEVPKDNNLAALAGLGEEDICAISLSSRIGTIAFNSREAMKDFVEFLSAFQYDPVPLSDNPVASDVPTGGSVVAVAPVNRKSHYLEEYLCFSEDFSSMPTSSSRWIALCFASSFEIFSTSLAEADDAAAQAVHCSLKAETGTGGRLKKQGGQLLALALVGIVLVIIHNVAGNGDHLVDLCGGKIKNIYKVSHAFAPFTAR